MEKKNKLQKLTIKEKLFVERYILDWNGTQSYCEVYKTENKNAAGVQANKLLRKPKIQAFMEEVQKDLARIAGVSRLKVLNELNKLAFSSIAHLHNSWITRVAFENLTDDQKACISEISTQTRTIYESEGENKIPVEVEYVKIKLYDKPRALELINKMLGYNEAEKIDNRVTLEKDKERIKDLFPTAEEFNATSS